MCKCKGIRIGSYDRQTSMRTPKGKWVCIDTCLVQEIAELWHKGIETIESCCGHNKAQGYIATKDKIGMDKLGYHEIKKDIYQPKQLT